MALLQIRHRKENERLSRGRAMSLPGARNSKKTRCENQRHLFWRGTPGIDPSRIYEDMASGRHDARPGLTASLKALQPGNTLVIWKLDRLGRDLRHLVTTAEDLRLRGNGLKVMAGAGAQIDTTSANGRLAFGIFAAFAEFERELIAERTHAGSCCGARARSHGRSAAQNEPGDSDYRYGGDVRSGCRCGRCRKAPRDHDYHALCLRQRRRQSEGTGTGVA